ncbi:MAG: DUF2284 domain-containing protein [Candidatus Lokiarchaeota archaeon]|nr:DUF2284 domain-containing protein [Candidatus Lokiarchaeota archaeon]
MDLSEDLKKKIKEIKSKAIKYGASDMTTLIEVKDIVLPNWPRMKCKFGCKGYGKNLSCPPYIPEPEKWREFLQDYSYALLIIFEGDPNHFFDNAMRFNKKIYKLERKAFLKGFQKSFGFFIGPCKLCDECIVNEENFPKDLDADIARSLCKHLDKSRPSMEAAGIDVFETIRSIGLDIEVITSRNGNQDVRFYGLLLLE